MKKIFYTFFVAFIFVSCLLYSQDNKIDSLLEALDNSKPEIRAEVLNSLATEYLSADLVKSNQYADEALKISEKTNNQKEKASAIKTLGSIYLYKGELDKALDYYQKSQEIKRILDDKKGVADLYFNFGYIYKKQNKFEKAINSYENALKIYGEIGMPEEVAAALRSKGQLYFFLGSFDRAVSQFEQAYEISKKLNDDAGKANSLQMLGIIYQEWANYEKALECYQNSIKIYEVQNDKVGIANTLNNIGLVYKDWGKYSETEYGLYEQKALENFKNSFELMSELNDKYGMANSLVNIGSIYEKLDSVDLALENYHKALSFEEEIGDKNGSAGTLENIGVILSKKKMENEKALEYLNRSLEIRNELGNKQGIASTLQNIGSIHIKLKNYGKATDYLNQSLILARELNKKELVKDIYDAFSLIYDLQGNYKLAFEYYKKFIAVKDSMFSEESHERITELETKYETEKKQKEIELLNNKQKLQDEQIENQKNLIITFIIGFIMFIIFTILIIREYRQKRKANLLLAEQKQEIQAQRDLATEQRDMIAIQKKEMTDSIHYALRIQSAVLPPENVLTSFLADHFIFYKPRDIVSGDFYWMNVKNNKVVVAAADCTGHGVPGAFMSLLGITFLNEIVNQSEILSADVILNRLRANIMKSLHQTGKEGEAKDGMDIALVIIDKESMKLEYSGAYNPIYMIQDNNSEILEYKADKMPISIHTVENKPFTNNIIDIAQGTQIYLFSDGFADQFGGEKYKKFKYNRFKELLFENRNRAMDENKMILESTFNKWKGHHEQIDDILVIGLKI